MYAIALTHGPVDYTEYIGDDTVIFHLEDGRIFTIKFTVTDTVMGKQFRREIKDDNGSMYADDSMFDVFDEGLTSEDYAQWTADNFSEIEELLD